MTSVVRRMSGQTAAQAAYQVEIVGAGIAAIHRLQQAIRAALHRQVQMVAKLFERAEGSNQFRRDRSFGCEVVKRILSMPGRALTRPTVRENQSRPRSLRP